MTKIQLLKNTILYLGIVFIGNAIMIQTWIYAGWLRILMFGGFFGASYGLGYLCSALMQWLFPTVTRRLETAYGSKFDYKFLKPQVGAVKAILILVVNILMFFGLWVFNMIIVFQSFTRQEQEQFKKFGQFQKIEIKDIRYKGKGGRKAFFEINWQGKKYSQDLPSKNFKIGDSAMILFSTISHNHSCQ
jgi:hypothetical protein